MIERNQFLIVTVILKLVSESHSSKINHPRDAKSNSA